MNPTVVVVCAWCPTFDRRDPKNKGVSHGICPTCAAKMLQAVR
jgi:hypothetical protein